MFKFLISLFVFLFFCVGILFFGQFLFNKFYKFPEKVTYGVTFSPQYAKYLGLDWKKLLSKLTDDLQVKDIRVPGYWEEIEAVEGKYKFDDLDYIINKTDKAKTRVVLVVGLKQPRWPECHMPAWVKKLSIEDRQKNTLDFIKKVVERYKDRSSVIYWQVENEPMLPFFGHNCDTPDVEFLKKEVELVRSLSPKPIIVSDSGELGSFITPMQLSDVFGTTLYRKTYDPILKYKTYPILPYLYNMKSFLVKKFFAPKNQKTVIVELQAEPWLTDEKMHINPEAQAKFFPVSELKDLVTYAQKTGFDTQYLWGVEWWYWMAEKGYPEYLDYAKNLFKE